MIARERYPSDLTDAHSLRRCGDPRPVKTGVRAWFKVGLWRGFRGA